MDNIEPFAINENAVQFNGSNYSLVFSLPDGKQARLTHDSVAALLDAAREVYEQRLKTIQNN